MNKTYNPTQIEPLLRDAWQQQGIYHFDINAEGAVYSVDTPPPTVSGNLHLGHVYSYSHADFMARFFRMRGYNVFYPMGYDDNGLPTERLVERRHGVTAAAAGREAFIRKCLEVSEEAEKEYRALWQRLGLSVDWRYTYRTIDANSRRASQLSFLQLHRQGRIYRQSAPTIWCPECHTAIAQAELNDLERESEFVSLPFGLTDGSSLPIATTRPELLAACVAVFVHPQDERYRSLVGQTALVPVYGQPVPILADASADPQKGTGAVMCCTFGDQTDMNWYFAYRLPLLEAIDQSGRMTALAGEIGGLPVEAARRRMKELLAERGLVLSRQATPQSVRVHERCDTPVEIVVSPQWFVRILDQKKELLELGAQIRWRPEHMRARYDAWVENLGWDWAISRQRTYGVPFPAWFCKNCDELMLAEESALPVDPFSDRPSNPCACGSSEFTPDADVMDVWATASLSPQLAGQRLENPELYRRVFPFSLRPQAHEIIRTWAFYTIVKSHFHFGQLPWKEVLISGWGLAGEGMGKISKSRGGGPMPPLEMIERTSADAVRYWAASTGTGKDALINEDKIQMGLKLATKLWNVARFSQPFVTGKGELQRPSNLTSADRWILSRTQALIRRATEAFLSYEYSAAKNEIETLFWRDLADNYLEMAKQRLYAPEHPAHPAACFALRSALAVLLKLLAPLLPYVTEAVYLELFSAEEGQTSLHRTRWPEADAGLEDKVAEEAGECLVEIASAVRRYKSEQNLALATSLSRLQLGTQDLSLSGLLREAAPDLMSVTRAQSIEVVPSLDPALIALPCNGVMIGIKI